MPLSQKMSMENNAANAESSGEKFVHKVASSGFVLKFKVPSDNDKAAPLDERVNTAAKVEFPVTENDGSNETTVHTCDECGKCFKELVSLYGHKGVHRREENKRMRKVAAQTLKMVLMEYKQYQQDHLLASMTCSDKHISAEEEEEEEMKEVAEILLTLAQSFCKDNDVHVSSSSASSIAKCFECTACPKKFSSYYALGGHMSVHRSKQPIEEDEGTWKYVCGKCNEKFPTGQILGGHKRKHWWAEQHYNKMALDRNVKPALPILPHHDSERSGLVAVPTDENKQPAGTGLDVASHTVPLAGDAAVQQAQQAMSLDNNEIEVPVQPGVSDEDVAGGSS